VSFFYHNLAEDAYPCLANNTNAMDIIFCRNVLMYFTEAGKKKVMGKFYQCLLEGGSLVVSPAETSLQYLPRLEALFPGSTIYRKGSVKCEDAARGEETMHDTANYGLQPAADEDFLLPHVAPAPLPVAEPDSYAEALELYERGSYAGAEKKAALLIRDKDDGPALILLSRICANQGRLADALDFCERAIAAEKLNHEYYYLLATILLELGREDEAEVSLGRALYLNQDFALAHFALGNLARRTGMKKKSSRHFENALSVLRRYRPRDIVPGSEGITAGRMIEVISRTVLEGTLA
jgi:chemotaxis protein methyltransferase CheR